MPLDYTEFSKKIKQKYPQYKDIDDLTLAKKMVEKYPQYKNEVTFSTPKKKGVTVSPSKQDQKLTSSATQPKTNLKPSVSSSSTGPKTDGKPDGLYQFPGNNKAVYKKQGGEWYVDPYGGRNFTKLHKGDVKARVNLLENKATKVFEESYDFKFEEKPKQTPIVDKKEEPKEKIKREMAQDIFEEEFFVTPKKNMSPTEQVDFVAKERAIRELGKDATEDQIKIAEEKYKTSETLKMLKRKGYDVDLNGNLDDPKVKKALAEFNAKEELRLNAEGKQNLLGKNIDNVVNSKLMGATEEYTVPLLNKNFNKYGFDFQETGIGDAMVVRYSADGGLTYSDEFEIDLQSGDPEAQMNKLKSFMKNKYLNDYEKSALNDESLTTEQLITTMASNPKKYGDYMLSEGEFETYMTRQYRDVAQYQKEINLKINEFEKLNKQYQQTGDENTLAKLKELDANIKEDQKKLVYREAELEQVGEKYKQSVGEYVSNKGDQGNFVGGLTSSFAKGVTSGSKALLYAGMDAVAPIFIKDIVNPIEYNKLKDEGLSDSEISDKVTSQVKRTIVKDINEGITNVGSLGTVSEEYFGSKDRNLVEKALFGLAESVGAGISGATNKTAQALSFFAMSYNAMQDEFSSEEFDSMSNLEKQMWSGVYGLVIGQLEKIGFNVASGQTKSPLFKKFASNVIMNAIKEAPEDAAIETIDQLIGSSVKNTLKATGIKVANGMISEGTTEGVQSLFETSMKGVINEIHDKKLFSYVPDLTTKEGVKYALEAAAEEFAAGAIGGAVMGSYDSYTKIPENKRTDQDFLKLYTVVNDKILFKSLKINEIEKYKNGELSLDQLKEKISSINETAAKINKIPETLSVRSKRIAFDLINEKELLNKSIQGKDANLVKPQTDRIAEIDNQLKKIGEDAVKESANKEVTAEGGGVQYQGTQEGQPEVRQGEGAVGETTQPETDLGNRPVEGRSVQEVGEKVKEEVKTYIAEMASTERIGKDVDNVMSKVNNAEYISDSEINSTIETIFNEVESINNNKDYSEQTKKSLSDKLMNIAEQLDNYEFRTKTETVAVTQRGTAPGIGKAETIKVRAEEFFNGQKAEVNGVPVTFKSDNGRVEAVTENGEVIVLDTPTMKINEGDFEFDDNGSLTAVTVTDRFGTTAKFTGDVAMDLAIKQRENEIGTVEQADFETVYKEVETKYVKEKTATKPKEVTAVVQEEAAPDTTQVEPVAEEVTTEQPIAEQPVAEQPVAEQPTTEKPVAPSRLEELGKVIEGTTQDIDQQLSELEFSDSNSRVSISIKNAVKALSKILPSVKVIAHDNDASYEKATGSISKGYYDPNRMEIHINLNRANNRTAAHEVFHAIILSSVKNDIEAQRLTKSMITSVMKSLVNMKDGGKIFRYLNDFASNYEENIQNEEKLAELTGILYDNFTELPNPAQSVIRRWLDRLAKLFGLKPLTDKEAIDFINTIASSMQFDWAIEEYQMPKNIIKDIQEINGRFQADFSDAISKLTFVFDKNGDRFKKLEKDGYITRDKSLSDFNGKYVFLHQPDAAFSGMIFKDGEILVEGKGGVFYPIKFHEDGYFWASTDRTAKKMADDLNKVMEQNGGTIYMALTSAPSDKLMSSTTMSNAILDFFSSKAFDKNFKVTPAQLKSALRKAANNVKTINNKNVGLDLKLPATATVEEMQSAIRTALGSENSSFADRKNFAMELTKIMASEINKNEVAVNQFGKLFSDGIQNKYFKGITKTGKLKISAANMTQALSEMFTEPMLKEGIDREKGGQVYAILELNGPVKAVKSDKHESYPMAIESANKDNKVTLHLLNDRQNWSDTFEDFQTGDIVSKKRQLKIYPTSGVSVRGLKVNTSKVAKGEKTARNQLLAPNGKPSNLNEKQWNQVRTPEFKKWFGDWENDPANASKVVDENGEPLVVYHGSAGGFDEFSENHLGNTTDAELAKSGFFFTNNSNVADTYRFVHKNANIDELKSILEKMSWDELVEMNNAVMKTVHFKKGYEEEDGEYALDDFIKDIEDDSDISNYLDSLKYIYKASDFLKSKGIDFEPYVGGELYEVFLNIKSPYKIDGDGDTLDTNTKIDYDKDVYDGVIIGNVLDAIPMSDKDGGVESDVFITKNPSAIKSATENVGTFNPKEKSIRNQIDNSFEARNQNPQSIASIIKVARENGFTDQEITQYLLQQGYSQDRIDSAMKFGVASGTSIDDVFETSTRELESKLKKGSVGQRIVSGIRSFRRSLFDRQNDIKRGIKRIKNPDAINAYSRLVTKAGATGFASLRFKILSKKIYGGLNEDQLNALDKMIYARRIISVNENRAKKGLEPYRGIRGYSEADAQNDLVKLRNELGEKTFNKLSQRADDYFNVFSENLLKLKQSGRISEEVYNELKDIEYSPIKTIKYIIKDNYDVNDLDNEAAKLGVSKKDIMALGDRNENGIITDSKWLLMLNISSVESRVFENKMLNDLVAALENATAQEKASLSEFFIFDNPIIGNYKTDGRPKRKYDEQSLPDGYRKLHYFDNGVDRYLIVREDIAKQLLNVKNSKILPAIENFSEEVPVLGWLAKHLILTPTRLLRFFATGGNPMFILGNVPMDWTNAVFFSDVYSNLKIVGMAQAGVGFSYNFLKKIWKDFSTTLLKGDMDKIYMEYAEHGGLMDTMSQEGLRSLQKLKPKGKVLNILPKKIVRPVAKTIIESPYKILNAYGSVLSYMGETSEIAFRLAVYEKAKSNLIKDFKKKNKTNPDSKQLDDIMWQASREARELIDFNQGGTWAKELDVFMPYFNAAMQGLRRPLDYAKKDPIGFSSSMIQLGGMAASIAGLSLSLAMGAFADDDEEERKKKLKRALDSISTYEKGSYHIIFTGRKNKDGELEYVRIKKLPVASIISTLAEELIYKKLLGYDIDYKNVKESISKSSPFSLSELGSKNPLISGIIAYAYNIDTFTGDEIVRLPKDKKINITAEGMFDDKVEGLYKTLAPGLGLSPARTKAFVEKIITSESTNPTINLFYAIGNGIFDPSTTFGKEFSTLTEEVLKQGSKKLIKYTNKDIIKYNLEDELEKKEMDIETDIYLKEQSVYNKIKKQAESGRGMSEDDLIDIVVNTFDEQDQEKYYEKYMKYMNNMDIDKSLLDIIYEDNPKVTAMKLFQRYGSNLSDKDIDELSEAMSSSGRNLSERALQIYENEY